MAAVCFNVKGPDLCFLDLPAELVGAREVVLGARDRSRLGQRKHRGRRARDVKEVLQAEHAEHLAQIAIAHRIVATVGLADPLPHRGQCARRVEVISERFEEAPVQLPQLER